MFRLQFPEFGTNVSDPMIVQYLASAALELSPCVWGNYGTVGNPMTPADQGHLYLAAHKLATGPFGQNAKLVNSRKDGFARTAYGQEFERLMRQKTFGFRVA